MTLEVYEGMSLERLQECQVDCMQRSLRYEKELRAAEAEVQQAQDRILALRESLNGCDSEEHLIRRCLYALIDKRR